MLSFKRRARERRAVIEVVDAMIAATWNDNSTADGAEFMQKYLGTLAVALGSACERHGLDEAGAQRVYDAIGPEVACRERAAAELADSLQRC
ncbi:MULTISPECIES: hypothetical protein [Bradyrhizobium]|uniref:hypothetical protein n=1 Tax=Bradyrhizobium TaxID=374 RepID=UPI00155F1DDD|nr:MULTISPECIES: hypothetical protein [Bradyrhizobium]